MAHCPKCKKEIPFLIDKKTALLYSLFLSIGSVSVFVSLTGLYTTYLAYIWSYSTRYMINALTLTFVLCISGVLLLLACLRLMQAKKTASLFGYTGMGLLLVYALVVLFIDPYISNTLTYMLVFLIALVIVLVSIFFFWKKRSYNVQ